MPADLLNALEAEAARRRTTRSALWLCLLLEVCGEPVDNIVGLRLISADRDLLDPVLAVSPAAELA